jgi:hypothetical protein
MPPASRLLTPLALVVAAALPLAGCGNSTDGTGSAGGAAGATGSAGSGNAAGGNLAGVTSVTCQGGTQANQCSIKGGDNAANIAAEQSECTSAGGTLVDHCASAGLVGCCLIAGLGASSVKASCPSWTTTAP